MTLAKKIVFTLITNGCTAMDDLRIEGHSKDDVKGAVRVMHKQGMVRDCFKAGQRHFYVDKTCKVPRLTTYHEVLEIWK